LALSVPHLHRPDQVSDLVIVGGGLAGAAAAARLAHAGKAPVVLEREKGPRDKICGEFLSAEAQAHLAALGLDVAALGGSAIGAVRLVSSRRSVVSPLPFKAVGLSRRRLDEALLAHAERLGASVRRGVAARRILSGRLETTAGDIGAASVLLASGKHDVRGARRDVAGADIGMVGFKSYFSLSQAMRRELEGFVEVVLFEGGYAGLQLVEDGVANLCLLVRRERFKAIGGTWPALFAALLGEPHLARRLDGARELSARPLTIADVPYGFVCRAEGPSGLYRLGDQAAVIASFTGDGMSIALHSAHVAADAVLAGAPAAEYHARLARDVARPVRLAHWLQRRLETWPGRHAAVLGLSFAPRSLAHLAAWTRVPKHALARAGL
jgi:flavin-dependent dehydrogenase